MLLPHPLSELHGLTEEIKKGPEEWFLPFISDFLADSECPINLEIMQMELPLNLMLEANNKKLAQLFLQCPRVDWLAPTHDRNLKAYNQKTYGIKFQKKKFSDRFKQEEQEFGVFDYFYLLPEEFEELMPEESRLIYEKVIAEVAKLTKKGDDLSNLLLVTVNSPIAFEIASKYTQNVHVKNSLGQTPLHLAQDEKVTRLLLDLGADPNCLDWHEMTPLMHRSEECNWSAALVLSNSGSDVDFINCYGESYFTVCPDKLQWLNRFKLSEKLFCSALQQSSVLSVEELLSIFKKYPKYKQFFMDDWPRHLPALEYPCRGLKRLRIPFAKASKKQCVESIRQLIARSEDCDFDELFGTHKSFSLQEHANEFLQYAAKAGKPQFVKRFLEQYAADANVLIDGKPSLFVAKASTFTELLHGGADPFLRCDGLFFFERDGFCCNESVSYFWLTLLHYRDFDLFSRETETGKSLLDWMSQSLSTVSVGVSIFSMNSFDFPAAKISERLFEVMSEKKLDLLAPIDEDGNSAAHYMIEQDACVGILRRQYSVTQLHSAKNKAGVSALQRMMKEDSLLQVAERIRSRQELDLYLDECFTMYGKGFLKEAGGLLVSNLLYSECKSDFESIKYLVVKHRVPLDVIYWDCLNGTVQQDIFKFCFDRESKEQGEEMLQFLLNRGCSFSFHDFRHLLRGNMPKAVNLYLDTKYTDIYGLFAFLQDMVHKDCETIPFNDAFKALIKHTQVNLTYYRNGALIIERMLLLFSFDSVEKFKFFHENGYDVRNLIYTTAEAEVPSEIVFTFDESVLKYMKEIGWTLEDFKSVRIGPRDNLKRYFEGYTQRKLFHQLFKDVNLDSKSYKGVDLERVIGDRQACAVCLEAFEERRKRVTLLECKHLFHLTCMKRCAHRVRQCPICKLDLS